MKNFYKILLFTLLVAIVVGVVGLNVGVSSIDAQTNKDRHNGVIVDHDADINGDLDVDGTTNLDVTDIDGAVDMATTATVGTGLTVTSGGVTVTAGGLTVTAGGLTLGQQSETVTATFVITPTAPYIVITSDAAYTSDTTTPIVAGTTGQVITIRNGNASDDLTIDGTGGTVECKGDVALGASDTLTLIYNGSDWNCLAGYDNS